MEDVRETCGGGSSSNSDSNSTFAVAVVVVAYDLAAARFPSGRIF